MDDIDRLEPTVTHLLFRMVRLCADFKNVTYILAFDSAAVERHLDPDDHRAARRYLEKIIQVSYNIPKPGRTALRTILEEELDDVRRLVTNEPLNAHRYERILDQGMANHFSTVRGVKRYVNALRLSLPPVQDQIDLVDFFVVELIRVVYPEVYEILSDNRYEVAEGDGDDGTPGNDHRALVQGVVAELEVATSVQASLWELICCVFPKLRGSKEDHRVRNARRAQWARERRVCCQGTVDRYFLFTIPTEKLSGAERDRFREHLRTAVRKTIREGARNAAKKGRTKGFLQTLGEVTGNIGVSKEVHLGASGAEKIAKAICTLDPEDDLRLRDRDNDGELLGEIVDKCIGSQQGQNQVGFVEKMVEYPNLFTVTKVIQHLSESRKIRGYSEIEDEVEKDLGAKLGKRILEEASGERGEERASDVWRAYRWHYLLSVDWKAGKGAKDKEGGTKENILCREAERVISGQIDRVIGARLVGRTELVRFCEACLDLRRYLERPDEGEEVMKRICGWLPAEVKTRLVELGSTEGGEGAMAAACLSELGIAGDSDRSGP